MGTESCDWGLGTGSCGYYCLEPQAPDYVGARAYIGTIWNFGYRHLLLHEMTISEY